MNRLARRLAVAAALAAVPLAPAVASACEPEPPRVAVTWGARVHAPPPVVYTEWRDRDAARDAWRRGAWEERERREWREREAWRERERVEIRAGYARLDLARADFYAVSHRPWRVHRFEAWCAQERAALDARWHRVDGR